VRASTRDEHKVAIEIIKRHVISHQPSAISYQLLRLLALCEPRYESR
jgi:hypothetical protein